MNTIVLDCAQLCERSAAHAYLAAALQLPAYYGRNLDALYDCLTELAPCVLALENTAALTQPDSYGRALLPVFLEASVANPNLRVELREEAEPFPL